MKDIQLLKFVLENDIDYRWHDDNVILFINKWDIDDWFNLFENSPGIFDDEGISCSMKDHYFAFRMKDICEYLNINMEEVFDKDKEE